MTEKRFYYSIYNLNEDDEYYEIIDKEERYSFNFIQDEGLASQVCSCLNEQQVTINKLKSEILAKENEWLRQMIKENVFGRYEEGSVADLVFKAIAYDDIVKLELSNESELKVIVICKQGKKENVKSFCQMFIPLGVYYEIKEINDE